MPAQLEPVDQEQEKTAQPEEGRSQQDAPERAGDQGDQGVELTEEEKQEEKKIEERAPVSAKVVHEVIVRSGEHELCRSNSALAWSGLAAGMSMGLSFIVEGLLRAHLPDTPWRPLIAKFGYPFGFLAVILGRQQLFTENTISAILPLMSHRNWQTFRQVARLWAVVLLANLAGAHVVAWVLGNTPAFRPEVQHAFAEIGHEAISVSFGAALLRGVCAGWIIALMVWILAAMNSGRHWIIILLTYVVALGGLTHIIAGSIEALFMVMTGVLPWTGYLGGYMLPTLIGNCLGGVALTSAVNHAQVAADGSCDVADLGERA